MKKQILIQYGLILCIGLFIGYGLKTFNDYFPGNKGKGDAALATVVKIKLLTDFVNYVGENRKSYPNMATWRMELLSLEEFKYKMDNPLDDFFDGWGNPIQYVYPGVYNPEQFDFYSFGQNGIDEFGAGDDIGSWQVEIMYQNKETQK